MDAPVTGNRPLSRLSRSHYAQLSPSLKAVSFKSGEVLYEAHKAIEFVYFPIDCVLSAVAVDNSGDGIEVGTIGNEGMAGLTAFLKPCTSPNRMLAQVPGDAVRIDAKALAEECKGNEPFSDLLLRHHQAFIAQITQSIACNGLHTVVQRCCRWLLMTHDRVGGNELPLTHEFLSLMLAVRRASVTDNLQTLQEKGLISTSRGTITIVDRAGLEAASCECYGIVTDEYRRLIGP